MSARKKVLIVDDEPDVVAYIAAVLQVEGFDVYSADNTEEALVLAEKTRPDLICLDIMMPRESGLSMYARLRANKDLAGTPVVIISGIQTEQEFDFRQLVKDRSIPAPQAFFEKPIDADVFGKALSRIVEKSGSTSTREENTL